MAAAHNMEHDTTTPPHSDESEIALLHSLLNGCDLRGAQLENLEPGHFYRAAHGWVYAAMLDLHDGGKVIDPVTLAERLKEREERDFLVIDGKYGQEALVALKDKQLESAMAVRSYAKTIKEKATRRAMLEQAQELEKMARDETVDPGVQISRHERELTKIRPFDLNTEFVEGKDSFSRHIKLLEDQAKTQVWHHMPFTALAERAPVMLNGDVAAVVGGEGSGKSSLLMQWAQFSAAQGMRSVYIHTEMNDKAVFDRRAVNANKRIRFNKLQKPDELGDKDWAEIVQTGSEINGYSKNLDYWHAGTVPESRLFTVMKHLIDTFGTRAFYLDYLNDVIIERERGMSDAIAWRDFLARLEAFNNVNHCITVTAAQLNKEGEAYQIGRALHQKAMLYLVLKTEILETEYSFRYEDVTYKYVPGNHKPLVNVEVRKYRGGGRGSFNLLYVGPRYLWSDVPDGFTGG